MSALQQPTLHDVSTLLMFHLIRLPEEPPESRHHAHGTLPGSTLRARSIFKSALLGAVNDRLMFVNPTEINPKQKKGVEIRSCLVGLLEPLLIGFATMQQHFEQKIDLPEVLYQITSRYGQFDSAKETFEVILDFESMLDLFICHLNPSALRHLSQRLEDAATDSELRRHFERILRVRSTGWGQGIFANFAAESMVPKGPEWGGGNWEIKTPISMKDIPQWELAGEVMPYMKTTDGGIPTIIADHIGVYLGVVRGRGNIVEVSEKSLIKPFMTARNENKSPTLEPLTNSSKQALNGTTKTNSMADFLTKQLAGVTPKDEQAKAEEEFKKSLYGAADGSSSEDDEAASKNKKILIRIRDKPIAAPVVDVSKIIEATKQFRLGDAPMRTKSSSGESHDISLVLPQPSPVTTTVVGNSSVDLFGNEATIPILTQTNPTITGTGVSAGPIPEDFFKNTIPSFEVAASLPPPGAYLSKMEQSSQVMEGNRLTSNREMMTNVGLPDGGVPPQIYQRTVSPIEGIGLPDGGVPPQSQAPAAALPAPMPIPSQPVDLSYLEISGPTKPLPTAVPAVVAPGHLSEALSCFDEAFLALAQDQSRGADIKAQATICAQYKIAVALLQWRSLEGMALEGPEDRWLELRALDRVGRD
ncbi:hypothetical protein KSP39_PZI015582 [Platanthera zijinensis]|uniref:Uncharacterized protein n=1 Tax=Platanthera zijinensis TaxID=2320716 RepID=A0AAP0G1F8_9ASPA